MTSSAPESPPADAPEADWAEQHTGADPVADEELGAAPGGLITDHPEANEADLLEQETVVYVPEEEGD